MKEEIVLLEFQHQVETDVQLLPNVLSAPLHYVINSVHHPGIIR